MPISDMDHTHLDQADMNKTDQINQSQTESE